MIIFNDDMGEAPTKRLSAIIGMTDGGSIYVYRYNCDKYRRRGDPAPFWENTVFGVNWSRANQPVKFALMQAAPDHVVEAAMAAMESAE